MAKMGRPISDQPKQNRLTIRFTDDEYEQLKLCAKSRNQTIAHIVREGAMKEVSSDG